MVVGAPFIVLGAQTNNSSNYPAMLPEVWALVVPLHDAEHAVTPLGFGLSVVLEQFRFACVPFNAASS